MARILIVGGGCRGRRFAAQMAEQGHALRVTTRNEDGRAAIEACGAECWIGTPDRLATLRGALESVTIACWMLAAASGQPGEVAALHSSRLEFFLGQAIDTTVRGFVYDARPPGDAGVCAGVSAEVLAGGEQIVRSLAKLNQIPVVVLGAQAPTGAEVEEAAPAGDGAVGTGGDAVGADEDDAWLAAACGAVDSLLGQARTRSRR